MQWKLLSFLQVVFIVHSWWRGCSLWMEDNVHAIYCLGECWETEFLSQKAVVYLSYSVDYSVTNFWKKNPHICPWRKRDKSRICFMLWCLWSLQFPSHAELPCFWLKGLLKPWDLWALTSCIFYQEWVRGLV